MSRDDTVYQVGNRADETLTNVMVEIKLETPRADGAASPNPPYYHSVDDGIKFSNRALPFFYYHDRNGRAWYDKTDPNDDRTWAARWLMPTIRPAASHNVEVWITDGLGNNNVRIVRHTVTMSQLAPDGTALCKTERVYWTRSYGSSVDILKTEYRAALSVDERHPAVGDTANFKVRVNAWHGYGVNARVEHTSGLTLASTPSAPTKTEWKNYSAANRKGDFFIGTEEVGTITTTGQSYEITLPMRLKSGATLNEQCVTVAVTGFPEAAPRALNQTGDDPSDNAAKLCLGDPPAAELPVLLTDGRADLLNLHGCVGKSDYPCDSTDSVELVVGGKDAAANAGMQYPYFQPEEVVVHIPDLASRNLHKNGTSTFWWSGSDKEAGHHQPNHPGELPGVAAKAHFECLTDKDPNNLPTDDPEYKGWTIAIADITDGQGNSVDHTPGAMIVTSLISLKNSSFSWVDVDGSHGSKRKTFTYDAFKLCGVSLDAAFAFNKLGTYKADITQGTKYQGSPVIPYSDTSTYTFHVGPIAELSVSDSGDLPDLASGETAFALDLANHGPSATLRAKAAVEMPAGATLVRTIPANLGTFHAAGTTAGVTHHAHWTWDAGVIAAPGNSLPRGRQATLVVRGATAGDTATATVSNGNGHCKIGSTTLPFVIRAEDCAALNDLPGISGAAWTLDNPYKVCIATTNGLADVSPRPASETACEATSGNEWHEGTVYDHRQTNNTSTLTARTGGSGLTSVSGALILPTVALNWPPASGASEYRVFRSATGAEGSYRRIARVQAPATTYTDEMATDKTTYHYLVEARYSDGQVAEIYAASATATTQRKVSPAPGSVRDLRAARRTNDENTIEVSWRAPGNATAATRYDMQYRSRGYASSTYDGWDTSTTEQTQTTYTFYNAGGGTSYQFRVRAINLVGDDSYPGSWSGAATVRPVSNPDQVRNLSAARVFTDETKIDVSWEAPSGGTTPTSYELEYRENGGAWTTAPNRTDTSATTYQLADAKGGSYYQFQARAVTITGGDTIYGSWRSSNTVSRVAAPGQVGSLRAERRFDDETKIDVTWTAPSNATSRTTYEISHQRDGGQWSATSTTDTTSSHEFDQALGNSRYVFRVRGVTTLATNERLEGSWRSSNTVSKVAAPNQVGSLRATRQFADERDIVVSWTAPNNATGDTSYEIQHQRDGGAWSSTSTASTTTYEFNDQALGQSRYVFRVRGVTTLSGTNERLEGSWRNSNTVQRVPTPGQVGNPRATRHATNDTIINVTWSAPSNATGATDYDVEYQEDGGAWTSARTNLNTTTYEFTSANGNYRYVFRVRAVTVSDGSDLEGSWRSSNTVPVLPAPNRVGNVRATRDDANENRIVVSWSAPTSGTTPTGYEVQYKENNAGDWKPDTPTDVTGTTTAVFSDATIIKGGSRYQFQVRAYTTLNSGTKLRGGWRSSNNVAGLPAGNILSVTATRDGHDPTKINISWSGVGARDCGLPGSASQEQRRLEQRHHDGAERAGVHPARRGRRGDAYLPGARNLRRGQWRVDGIQRGSCAAGGQPRLRRGRGLVHHQGDERAVVVRLPRSQGRLVQLLPGGERRQDADRPAARDDIPG